eukprot:GFUD01005716.1.p1 GENE.GFUD01005716.1~~GFUD01005716.1.p1  ORF type:complete len:245 (+),score=78.53 GFUD01005716.1:104-838(+)
MNPRTLLTLLQCNTYSVPITRYSIGNIQTTPPLSRYSTRPSTETGKKTKDLKVPAKALQWEDVKLLLQKCAGMVRGKASMWQLWHPMQGTQLQPGPGDTRPILRKYEEMIGLSEVKQSQDKVLQCESILVESLQERREIAQKIMDVQRRIKDIHMELEKTVRGENKYLVLVMQEHQVLKEEQNLLSELRQAESSERLAMTVLSDRVRESQEKERAHAERTKYWTMIGFLVGTIAGIFGSAIIRT